MGKLYDLQVTWPLRDGLTVTFARGSIPSTEWGYGWWIRISLLSKQECSAAPDLGKGIGTRPWKNLLNINGRLKEVGLSVSLEHQETTIMIGK